MQSLLLLNTWLMGAWAERLVRVVHCAINVGVSIAFNFVEKKSVVVLKHVKMINIHLRNDSSDVFSVLPKFLLSRRSFEPGAETLDQLVARPERSLLCLRKEERCLVLWELPKVFLTTKILQVFCQFHYGSLQWERSWQRNGSPFLQSTKFKMNNGDSWTLMLWCHLSAHELAVICTEL